MNVENTGWGIEVVARPTGEQDLGNKDRPHVLEFRHIFNSRQSYTNLEYLTLPELREVYAAIGAYLKGKGVE